MQVKPLLFVAAGLLASVAHGQTLTETLDEHIMFGINRSSGNLVRYDFNGSSVSTVGTLNKPGGGAMTGVDAAVLFPGFVNLYAFWNNPEDNKNNMVFVKIDDGSATVVHEDLEGGRITGATMFATAADPHTIFVVQQEKVRPPSSISGLANLNPNNTVDNEFTLTTGDDVTYTRHDLHKESPINGNGTFYQGAATLLHFKPKGTGSQSGVLINGEPFTLQNSNTYTFTGQMDIRVFNDKPNGGKAMGQWWVEVISGQVIINNDVKILSPNRLATVDQVTGAVNELMVLDRTYNSLATGDGVIFYATFEQSLYKLDTIGQSEVQVGATSMNNGLGLEFVGSYLLGYDANAATLTPIDPSTGSSLLAGANLGMGELGTIVFSPTALHAAFAAAMFD